MSKLNCEVVQQGGIGMHVSVMNLVAFFFMPTVALRTTQEPEQRGYTAPDQLQGSIDKFILKGSYEQIVNASQADDPLYDEIALSFTSSGSDWPCCWARGRKEGHPTIYQVHIPKAAGSSMLKDLKRHLPPGHGLFVNEMCYPWFANRMKQPNDRIFVMLRSPISHVYSQYLECANSSWGKKVVPLSKQHILTNVSTWLQHFTSGVQPEKQDDDLSCYHPLNMQTRMLANGQGNGHHYQVIKFEEAKANLKSPSTIVGLVEHYHASLCLALTQVTGQLPDFCDCRNKEAWSAVDDHHINYDVRKHSSSDLSPEDKTDIASLTEFDEALYAEGAQLFREQVARVERDFGAKLICD